MATGDDGRASRPGGGGAEATDVTTAPTMEGVAAVPTPVPAASGDDKMAISGADTAVATRSQTMQAQAPPADADPDDPVADTLIDTLLLDRYQVTRKIGQGGMGAVYEATHMLIGKRVAVKVLLDKYAQKDPIVARLEQEARLASSIGHENIIDITDFGQTGDGRTFVVMEYLEGESLGVLVQREGHLDEQRAIQIARQAASALGAAHAKGVLHRDVKPDNIFLLRRRDRDFVKVVDFGISKAMRPGEGESENSPRLTQTGMVLGTPLYMSPEQARGDEDLDHRIDIYAMGVILYEMVTGEVPFRGSNYLSILSQVLNDEPPSPRTLRPDLSIELEAVIMKALSKEPEDRYQSMEELADDLQVLAATEGTTTSRSRISAERYRPKRQRRSGLRILAWVAGVAVVVAAVAVTVTMMMGGGGKKQPAAAPAVPIDAGAVRASTVPLDAGPAQPAVEVVSIPIQSIPPGADIYFGDRYVGKTPCDFKYEKVNEQVELIAELDGYHDAKAPLNPYVEAGSDEPVTFRMRKVKKGTKRTRFRKEHRDATGMHGGPRDGKKHRPKDDTAAGELTGNPYEKK